MPYYPNPGILASLVVTGIDAVGVPVVVNGASGQTADLQQWKNNAGTLLANVTSTGGISAQGASALVSIQNPNAAVAVLNTYTDGSHGMTVASTLPGYTPLSVKGAVSQAADIQQWQTSDGVVKCRVTGLGQFVTTPGQPAYFANETLFNAALNVSPPAASWHGIVIRALAGQSADLQQWQSSDGTVVAKIRYDGLIATTYVRDAADSGPYFYFNAGFIQLQSTATSQILLNVVGVAGQTGNLTQWATNAGIVQSCVRADGAHQWYTVGDEGNAGVIMARPAFAPNSLCIIGSGTTASNRDVYIFDTLGVSGNIRSTAGYITAGNIAVGTTVDFGSGNGVLALKDATTAPSANPAGGGVLYSQAGVLKWRSPSGVTAVAPASYVTSTKFGTD